MDPHTENNGGLGPKFEDFEYPPAEQVWRRVQVEVEGDEHPGRLLGHLGEFSHAPAPAVWERIAAEVHPNRRATVFWWAATAASIALLLVVGLRFGRGGENREEPGSKATWSVTTETDSSGNSQSGTLKALSGSDGRNALPAGDGTVPQPGLREQGLSALLFVAVDAGGDVPDALSGPARLPDWPMLPALATAADTFPYSGQQNRYLKFARKQDSTGEGNWDELPPLPDRDRSLYSASLASGWVAPASSFALAPGRENLYSDQSDPFTGLSSSVGGGGQETSSRTENFNTPVVVGLQMRRNLSDRLSLGIGPTYTLMTSTRERVRSDGKILERIRRQYLGVSLSANYEFWQRRRLSAYFSAGTRFDFGLELWKRKTEQVNEGGRSEVVTRNYPGNQALANAGIGVDYDLTESLGLYLQGSVLHAFYRTHPNLWTVRRFWPGLQVGLRLQL